LQNNQRDWEILAQLDPLWAISTFKEKKFNKWNVEQFFLKGEKLNHELSKEIKQLGYPVQFKTALDFGCGVGRVSRFIAKSFEECYGADISETMVALAKKYNQGISNCKFIVNSENNLSLFSDNYFDLVYSRIVLQHIPEKEIIKFYIREFVRILKKKGLLYFQLPSQIPLQNKIRPIRRIYTLLREMGINEKFLYNKMKITPIMMNYIPEKEVLKILESEGAKILEIRSEMMGKIESRTYLVTKL